MTKPKRPTKTPKPHLVLELGRYGNVVIGRVLEQVGIDRNFSQRLAGYAIESGMRPELWSRKLFVRGTQHDQDNSVFSYEYPTPADAIAAMKAFTDLVRQINGHGEPATSESVELVVVE